jgi:rubrerythrin
MVTRQAFLLRGALAVGAAFGAGAVQPFVSRASAQERSSESEVLDFLLTLEHLEREAYRAALRRVPSLTPEADDILNVLADNEQRHVEALRQALQDIGAQPSEPPHFDFGDAVADQEAFLEVAQKLEDVGVYAYNGAIPNVRSEPLVTLLAATVQVEGRHAAAIRQLRGFPIVQSAFDVGVGGERAFRAVDHLILS